MDPTEQPNSGVADDATDSNQAADWSAAEEARAARTIELFIRDRDRPCAVHRLYGRSASFEWRKLINQVRMQPDQGVLICEVPDRRAMKAAARDLREFLALRGQRLVRLPTASLVDVRRLPRLLRRMRRFPDPRSPYPQNREAGALWLSCPAPERESGRAVWLAVWQKALQALDGQMDDLLGKLNVPLVVVGPPRIQFLLRRETPELWSRRALLVRLEESLEEPARPEGQEAVFWEKEMYRAPAGVELEVAVREVRMARAALGSKGPIGAEPALQMRHIRAQLDVAGALLLRNRVIEAEDMAERAWLALYALETYARRDSPDAAYDPSQERALKALLRRTLASVHLYRRDLDQALDHALSFIGYYNDNGYLVIWPVLTQCVLCLSYKASAVPMATRFLKETEADLRRAMADQQNMSRTYEVMRKVSDFVDTLRSKLA